MITLDEAKVFVHEMLAIHADPDMVAAAIDTSASRSRQFAGYTQDHDDTYTMYKLALADITGNAKYRG